MASGLIPVIRVSGTERLVNRLMRETDRATAEQALLDAIADGTDKMKETMGRLAPVGSTPVQRIRLRQGLVRRKMRRDEARGGIGWGISPRREVSHASFSEFGTPQHPADPFMRRSFERHKGDVIRGVKRHIIGMIRKIGR